MDQRSLIEVQQEITEAGWDWRVDMVGSGRRAQVVKYTYTKQCDQQMLHKIVLTYADHSSSGDYELERFRDNVLLESQSTKSQGRAHYMVLEMGAKIIHAQEGGVWLVHDFAGLTLLSKVKDGIPFSIDTEEIESAIETLLRMVESGQTIALNDNRNRREGAVLISFLDGEYSTSGGGHGFSTGWKWISKADVKWLIRVTAPYNVGESEGETGMILSGQR